MHRLGGTRGKSRLLGRPVVQGVVEALPVIQDRDGFDEGRPRRRPISTGAPIDPRLLQPTVPRREARVVPAVPLPTHPRRHAAAGYPGWVRGGGLSTPAAGGRPPACPRVPHRQILEACQVEPAVVRCHVRDVRQPRRMRCGRARPGQHLLRHGPAGAGRGGPGNGVSRGPAALGSAVKRPAPFEHARCVVRRWRRVS